MRRAIREQPTRSANEVVTNALTNYPPQFIVPSRVNLLQVARNEKTKFVKARPVIRNAEELEIPDEMASYNDGENGRCLSFHYQFNLRLDVLFYRGFCETSDGKKHHIFATDRMLNLLKESDHWLADGTFKVAPKIFHQLYVIHAQWLETETTLPCVYVLMSRRKKIDYVAVFEWVKVCYWMFKAHLFIYFSNIVTIRSLSHSRPITKQPLMEHTKWSFRLQNISCVSFI